MRRKSEAVALLDEAPLRRHDPGTGETGSIVAAAYELGIQRNDGAAASGYGTSSLAVCVEIRLTSVKGHSPITSLVDPS
jgi:hypothetical protein